MKKHLIVIGTAILILAVGLSGCEELEKLDKPDYITVTVRCVVNVQLWQGSALNDWTNMEDINVQVEIIKDGGERVSKIVTTNMWGKTQETEATFKLYREQPINCIGNVILSSVEKYPEYTFNSAVRTLPWGQVYPAYDFGESAEWNVELIIKGNKNVN